MNPDTRTHTGVESKIYASIAADTDLAAEYPLATSGQATTYKLPREIYVFGAGNLIIEHTRSYESAAGTTVTIPATAGYRLTLGPRILKAATAATNILVVW